MMDRLHSKEHDELMKMFERLFKGRRLDREPKESWDRGIIYQNGEVNEMFLVFRKGYAFGKAVGRDE